MTGLTGIGGLSAQLDTDTAVDGKRDVYVSNSVNKAPVDRYAAFTATAPGQHPKSIRTTFAAWFLHRLVRTDADPADRPSRPPSPPPEADYE
jgi:hypothetical protein